MSLLFPLTPASHERRLLVSAVDSRNFMVHRWLAVDWPISFLSLRIAGLVTLLHGMKASHFWRREYPLHF
jgi:hypothetical protein